MESAPWTALTPWVQLGFAGFAFLQIVVIVWLFRQLIDIQRIMADKQSEWSLIVAGNTVAISNVHETATETKKLLADVRDQLLSRPCLMAKPKEAS